jgi:hypothetical protein
MMFDKVTDPVLGPYHYDGVGSYPRVEILPRPKLDPYVDEIEVKPWDF